LEDFCDRAAGLTGADGCALPGLDCAGVRVLQTGGRACWFRPPLIISV